MAEQNILVSIIVPVYGTEEYLSACIESIRRQSYKNIEIILVDDQSPDKCPEICDAFAEKDERIKVVHQKNKGVSGARNTGMDFAKGDYLMFVDSDDELFPEAVETLLKDASEYEAQVVSAIKKKMSSKQEEIKDDNDGTYVIFRDREPLLLSLNGDKNSNSACAKLFKADFVSDIRFEEGKNINEDGFFMFLCYMKKPTMVQHNVPVYQYNYRQDSASKQVFSEKYLAMLYFCERKKELIAEKFPEYIEQAYNMEVRTHLQFLQVLCSTNEKKYDTLQKESVETVRRLYRYHSPINEHHKKLAWVVKNGLYPIYKKAVRFKYFR